MRACPFDGGELDLLGFCATGDGFPWTVKCPWVCTRCRRPLAWNGGCHDCKGSATPWDRATWRFEGDYYEAVTEGPAIRALHPVRPRRDGGPVPPTRSPAISPNFHALTGRIGQR